jgi:lambda repressor-like predicted transcriptional regulator
MTEIWVDCFYSNKYVVSNYGRIKYKQQYINSGACSYIRKENILKNCHTGRYTITTIEGRHLALHRVVYLSFYGNIPDNLVIDHIDGNTKNNNLTNLQAITQHQNVRKGKIKKTNDLTRGIYYDRYNKKYAVSVGYQNKNIWAGRYEELNDAEKISEYLYKLVDAELEYNEIKSAIKKYKEAQSV